MPVYADQKMATVETAQVLCPSIDLRDSLCGSISRLRVFQPSDQPSGVLGAKRGWRESQTPTSVDVPVHSPPVVPHPQVRLWEVTLRVVIGHEERQRDLAQLSHNCPLIPPGKYTNDLLFDGASALASATTEPPPAHTCNCDPIEARMARMSMILP